MYLPGKTGEGERYKMRIKRIKDVYEFIEYVKTIDEERAKKIVSKYINESVKNDRYGRIVIIAESDIANLAVDTIFDLKDYRAAWLLGVYALSKNPKLSSENKLRLLETGEPAIVEELMRR